MHTVNTSSCKVKFRSDSLSSAVCTRVCVREIYLRFTLFQYICNISLTYHFIFWSLFLVNVFREQFKFRFLGKWRVIVPVDRWIIWKYSDLGIESKSSKGSGTGISARNSSRFFCIECQPMRRIRSYSFSGGRNERRLISYWTIKGATGGGVNGRRQGEVAKGAGRAKDEGRGCESRAKKKKKEKVLSRATTKDFLNLV